MIDMNRYISLAILLFATLFSWAGDDYKTDISFSVCEKLVYYKSGSANPKYTTCRYRFDDITKVGDYDLTAFKAALYKYFSAAPVSTPEAILRQWSLPFPEMFEGELFEVNAPVKVAPKAVSSDDEGLFPYGMPYENTSLTYDWYNSQAHVLALAYSRELDTGGGTGAAFILSQSSYYYDFELGHRLQLSDLFKGNYKSALLKAVKQWLSANADEICLLYDISDITLSDTWVLQGNCIVFIYSKYEIACGAAGNIAVPIPSYELDSILLPKGRLLLGGN